MGRAEARRDATLRRRGCGFPMRADTHRDASWCVAARYRVCIERFRGIGVRAEDGGSSRIDMHRYASRHLRATR
ncbi:hypothetical protein WS71_05665 [Burkholderia mayonis]|uniref:Uncharacterized protein n=1 Tax=Burkholderia mayonis TaxID=1385591 RepID=A0A1B4FT60_9BURK|nr:hypothetical protein WS71_05665 [Burkholderia mayonis]KVE57622.1 hypothetical protein WS71_26160 [Burkholderia mayonis]